MKLSVATDGTVVFFTPSGKMLADAPGRPEVARRGEREGMIAGSAGPSDRRADRPASALPPVPSVHPGAPSMGEGAALSNGAALPNGAALYRDSDIPWRIEAEVREAVEESLG